MTDRPSVIRATRVRHADGGETSFAEPRTLVELDREKVEAVIGEAFTAWEVAVTRAALEHSSPWPDEAGRAQGVARAIFDALDEEGNA